MEVTTLSNLVALALEISGLEYDATTDITEAEFNQMVDTIFDSLDMHQKWKTNGMT